LTNELAREGLLEQPVNFSAEVSDPKK